MSSEELPGSTSKYTETHDIKKEDVLNGLQFDEVSEIQQILYLILKKIENYHLE